jgi:putative nucleotidyltransferase with HDIG domain
MATWASAEVFFRLGGPTHLHQGPLGTITVLGLLGIFGTLDFALTTLTVATAIALSTATRIADVWRQHFLGLWITYFGGVFAASLMMAVGSLNALEVLVLIAPLPVLLYVAFQHAQARAKDQIQHLGKMNQVYVAAIEALAQAVDSKDQVTHDHVRRVQTQSLALARAIGVRDDLVLEALKAAALLHDVGKIGIPEHILNKPGRRTPSEFDIMKQHAPMGADILARIDFPYPVVPIVRHHHENWDGTGYPDGLTGEAIPIGARILQIVDCFDALTSDRPYRRAVSRMGALQILAQRKGTMYDPRIVDAFFALQVDDPTDAVVIGPAEDVRAATPPSLQPAAATEDVSLPLASFYKVGRAVRRRSTMAEVGQALWTHLHAHVPAGAFVLYMYEPGTDALVATFCSHDNLVDPQTRIPLGERLSGWIAAQKRRVVNSDARLDLQDEVAADADMASILGVPAVLDDQVVGVLAFYSQTADVFTEGHCRIAEAAAEIVAEQSRRVSRRMALYAA